MGIAEALAALTFICSILVGPFIWIFIKRDIKFNQERQKICLRQKLESTVITFSEFCSIRRVTDGTNGIFGTNHDVLLLFFVQKQILAAMTYTSGFIILTCVSAFLFRAIQPGLKLDTLSEFIYSNNSVPWSVIIFIGSLIVFFITISAAHRFKKSVEDKIDMLRANIEKKGIS